jgi:signal transduction histidine kinase
MVVGDRHLISQALANLIDNAIKYTKPGGRITIRVTSSVTNASLIVTDTGPGIPEAARTKVLERFVRLDQSRHTPGSGLGLSLVAAVTKLHGGTLRLEDADPGLRVILSLPKQPA